MLLIMILKMTLVARLPWHWCLPIVSQISAMSMLGPALLGQTASEHYLVSTFPHLLRYSMCFRIMGVHTSVYITEALVLYSDSVFKSEKRGFPTQIQNGERKSKRTHAKIWPFGKSVNQAAAPRLVWFWLPEACQSILYQEFCTHNMSNPKCFFLSKLSLIWVAWTWQTFVCSAVSWKFPLHEPRIPNPVFVQTVTDMVEGALGMPARADHSHPQHAQNHPHKVLRPTQVTLVWPSCISHIFLYFFWFSVHWGWEFSHSHQIR